MTPALNRDGAQLHPGELDVEAITELVRILPPAIGPGDRIYGHPVLARWLNDGPVGKIARALAGDEARPVRAILFDKTSEANWALG